MIRGDNSLSFNLSHQMYLEEPTVDQLFAQNPVLRSKLEAVDGVPLAEKAASLLYVPSLQSNVLRIEAMIQLGLCYPQIGGGISVEDFADIFGLIGETAIGRLEDSAQNVMATPVWFQGESFLLLNGIWESGVFILQVLLDIVETMPNRAGFIELKQCVRGLLVIGEAASQRAQIEPYTTDSDLPLDSICSSDFPKQNIVGFTNEDLSTLMLDANDLQRFTAKSATLASLRSSEFTRNGLRRYPLLSVNDRLVLISPTSIPIAIRQFLIEFAIGNGLLETLSSQFQLHQEAMIKDEKVFGIPQTAPVSFRPSEIGPIAAYGKISDSREAIHLLFIGDDLQDIANSTSLGEQPFPSNVPNLIRDRIDSFRREFSEKRQIERGISIVVLCGIGRSVTIPIPHTGDEKWEVDYCSLEDLLHINRIYDMDFTEVTSILYGQRKAAEFGCEIDNSFGLANLLGWVRSNRGHVVPHNSVPNDYRRREFNLFLDPGHVKSLRAESLKTVHTRSSLHPDGKVFRVRRIGKNHLDHPDTHTYAPFDFDIESPKVVFNYDERDWWFSLCDMPVSPSTYTRWEMLDTWVKRVIPAIAEYWQGSSHQTVEFQFRFAPSSRFEHMPPPTTVPRLDEIEDDIVCDVSAENVVSITVGDLFELGTADPKNVAEHALVRAIVIAASKISVVNLTISEARDLADEIVGGSDARHIHGFIERTYRDRFCPQLRGVVEPTDVDNANFRLGLAFHVEPRVFGRERIDNKRDCTEFLNMLVSSLEDDLCNELRRFDRYQILEQALQNCEQATFERDRWEKTAQSQIALSYDSKEAIRLIVDRLGRFDACMQSSRLLCEVAMHECPADGGLRPGKTDLAKLLTIVGCICVLGGWSDAIHYEAMRPSLEITALGDVLADKEFENLVLGPFHGRTREIRVADAISERADFYANAPMNSTAETPIDPQFELAAKSELGFTIDDAIRFVDIITGIGIDRGQLIYRIRRDEVLQLLQNEMSVEAARSILSDFTSFNRRAWGEIGEEYSPRDIQLWRLRRRLSILRRPLLDLSDETLLIAPDIIKTAVAYTLNSYQSGAYRETDLKSQEMRTWKSVAGQRRGRRFAEQVAEKMTSLGWRTWVDIKVTAIVRKKLDRDYGDVDVLAFDETRNRLLIIECKDLHFHKTHGEVAEQLSDYRGKVNAKGKRDDLRKHLDRVAAIKECLPEIGRFVKTSDQIDVEPLLLFKNPVPMLFAWERLKSSTDVASFDDLSEKYDVHLQRK